MFFTFLVHMFTVLFLLFYSLPKLWRPNLMRRIFYSEILDKWLNIVVTLRTCDLVDEANGFDYYILKVGII